MRRRSLWLWLIPAVLALLPVLTVHAATYPSPVGYVNDFANVMSPAARTALESHLSAYEKSSTNEISVAVVQSLNGDTVENVAVEMFAQWGIGKKGADNGILLLVAVDDHKLKIEVGYGLEGALTDSEAGSIIRNVITPKFKQSDYDGGISAGVEAIIGQLDGTTPANALDDPGPAPTPSGVGSLLSFPVLGLFVYGLSFMARTKSWWAGGIGGALLGGGIGLAAGDMLGAAIAGVMFGLFGLFLDFVLSRTFANSSHPARHGWLSSYGGFYGGPSSSGGSGWGGGSSGGFGGFGGGSSGGGGASGGW